MGGKALTVSIAGFFDNTFSPSAPLEIFGVMRNQRGLVGGLAAADDGVASEGVALRIAARHARRSGQVVESRPAHRATKQGYEHWKFRLMLINNVLIEYLHGEAGGWFIGALMLPVKIKMLFQMFSIIVLKHDVPLKENEVKKVEFAEEPTAVCSLSESNSPNFVCQPLLYIVAICFGGYLCVNHFTVPELFGK